MKKKIVMFAIALVLSIACTVCLAACDDGSDNAEPEPAEIGFMSGTGGTIDGDTMSLEVGTTVETVDLAQVIYAKGGAIYTVCEKEDGTLPVPDKKLKLKNGDNTFYVIADLDGNKVTYTLNVWKNFYTTIRYYVNGDLFDSQRVLSHTYLEDFRAPEDLEYEIEFLGWDCEGYYVTEMGKEFHAKLKYKKSTTVHLNADGGKCDKESVQIHYGEDFTLPVPTKEGYSFFCWILESEELTPISFSDGKGFEKWTIEDDEVTVYAFWTQS